MGSTNIGYASVMGPNINYIIGVGPTNIGYASGMGPTGRKPFLPPFTDQDSPEAFAWKKNYFYI